MADSTSDEQRLAGQVALVTGAGRGIGRAHALRLAQLGAAVIVNDPGDEMDGAAHTAEVDAADPAERVVQEIVAAGGRAVADRTPVGAWSSAQLIVAQAVEQFGRLDILVNNAGILRRLSIVDMAEQDWADVLRVHLDGAFSLTHAVALHWRARSEAGEQLRGRIVNTTSASGLFAQGRANYAAAKAGVVALTQIAALELAPYGATVNAVAPVALTRMSVGMATDEHSPRHVAQVVAWLCSPAADAITGHVFNVAGGHVSVVERPHTGPSADAERWSLNELDDVIPRLVDRSAAHPDLFGYRPDEVRPESLASIVLVGPDRRRREAGDA